jgi:hypothetical protein
VINIYQEGNKSAHVLEFLMLQVCFVSLDLFTLLQGDTSFFYTLFGSLREHLASQISETPPPVSPEKDRNLFPLPPPSLPCPEDITQGIASLQALLFSRDPSMRVEGLKIIVDLLAPPTESYLAGDRILLIEGFYHSGVVAYFVESLHQILNQYSLPPSSLSSFEIHLLMVSLGRVIQAKVIQVNHPLVSTILTPLGRRSLQPQASLHIAWLPR